MERLLVIFAVYFLALMLAPVMYIVTGDIHESGHALACMALGGNVGGFLGWLHGVLPYRNPSSTDCSIKPYPPLMWAGGAIASIAVWWALVFAVGMALNRAAAPRSSLRRFFWLLLGIVWSWWCLWLMGEFFNETRHAYAAPNVWQDSTQFVHVTGINPNLVGLPLAAMFVVTAAVLVLYGRRFVNLVIG